LRDRPQQILDVHDQHRRAVVQQRAGRDVLDLAEQRIERLHHQLALAEEAVHDDAARLRRPRPRPPRRGPALAGGSGDAQRPGAPTRAPTPRPSQSRSGAALEPRDPIGGSCSARVTAESGKA
jgi:hypothetical protein